MACNLINAKNVVLSLLLFGCLVPHSFAAQDLFAEFQGVDVTERISVIVTLHEADEELKALRKISRVNTNNKQTALARQAQRKKAITRHQDKTLSRLNKRNYRLARKYSQLPFLSLKVNRQGLRTLLADPDVSISKEHRFRPLLDDSVPLIFDEVGTYNPVGMYDRGAGWAVAVIDTGIEKDHLFLGSNRVVSEACFSSATASHASLCPGGELNPFAPDSGEPCTVDPDCNHGTLMAGIVAGDGEMTLNEGSLYDGVATAAELISIMVFSFDDSLPPADLFASTSDILAGMDHVIDLSDGGSKIASVLLAIGNSTTLEDCDGSLPDSGPDFKIAIDNLKAAGIATVAASGNDGSSTGFNVPACITSAISVGASDDSDNKLPSSNEGTGLDLYAPGDSITSSNVGGGNAAGSGTSFAAAHVAGAWAVLKEAFPHATVNQLTTTLQDTGANVSNNNPSGAKRIDLKSALAADIPDIGGSTFFTIPLPGGGAAIFNL